MARELPCQASFPETIFLPYHFFYCDSAAILLMMQSYTPMVPFRNFIRPNRHFYRQIVNGARHRPVPFAMESLVPGAFGQIGLQFNIKNVKRAFNILNCAHFTLTLQSLNDSAYFLYLII